MRLTWPVLKDLLTTTVREVSDDDVPSLAAAIAYYTVFSLPPLLVLLVGLAGLVFGPEAVADMLANQAASAVGPAGAETVRTMIENAGATGSGVGAKVIGFVALLFGATGAFGQLQKALNRAWEVDAKPEGGAIQSILIKRVLSFGMVLTVAFLLLVSLVLTTVLSVVGDAAASVAGEGLVGTGVQILNVVVSLGVIGVLFAVLFRTLPDVDIPWRDVAVGAGVTAVLFTLGKTLIAFYLARAEPGSAFGAAGSLALLLVWIYYSALIVLVGAEFTQAWSQMLGVDAKNAMPTVGGADSEVHPAALPRDPAPY